MDDTLLGSAELRPCAAIRCPASTLDPRARPGCRPPDNRARESADEAPHPPGRPRPSSSLRHSPLPPTRPNRPSRSRSRSSSSATRGTTAPPIAPRRSPRSSPAAGSRSTYTEKMSDLNPETLGKYDALLIYANTTRISTGPGEGPARLRRGRRRLRPAPLRLVLLPQLARVHRPGRRPVPEARHRRVRDDGRRPRPPDHEGARAVPHLGRDLRPHQAQHEGPPRPPDPRRPGRLRALDLGPHAGQGPRLLHRLRPRRPDLGPPRLPRPGRARHPLGREQGGRLRLAAARGDGPEAVRVRAGRDPALPPRRPVGHAGRADPQDAEAALAGGVAASTSSCRPASRRSCSPPSRRSPSRSA